MLEIKWFLISKKNATEITGMLEIAKREKDEKCSLDACSCLFPTQYNEEPCSQEIQDAIHLLETLLSLPSEMADGLEAELRAVTVTPLSPLPCA